MITLNRAIALLIAGLVVTTGVTARAIAPGLPPPDGSSLLLGQYHNYSVTLRGNGEAVVLARLAFSNTGTTPLATFSFTIPSAPATDITVFQQKLPPTCLQYAPTGGCVQSGDPDYTTSYFPDGAAEYKKITPVATNNRYVLALPFIVEPSKASGLIIAYTSRAEVIKRFGLFNYKFATLKVPERVASSVVAINVDSGLYLRGTRENVAYTQSLPDIAALGQLAADSSSLLALDRAVQTIGLNGDIVKETSNLAPDETFVVEGDYAKSWARLYLASILWALAVVGLILTITYFVARKIGQRSLTTAASVATGPSPWKSAAVTATFGGLGSAVFVVLITVFHYQLTQLPFWNSWVRQDINTILAIVMFLIYALAIFGPAAFLTSLKNWRAFLSIILLEILWLSLFLILYATLFTADSPKIPLSPRTLDQVQVDSTTPQ